MHECPPTKSYTVEKILGRDRVLSFVFGLTEGATAAIDGIDPVEVQHMCMRHPGGEYTHCLYVLRSAGTVVAVLPALVRPARIPICLAHKVVAGLSYRCLHFYGINTFGGEGGEGLFALFDRILQDHSFEALRTWGLPTQSPLWKYLSSEVARRRHGFLLSRVRPVAHHLIRLPGSFDEYMSCFKSKTRYTMRRKIRILREHTGGDLVLRVFRTEADVAPFLEAAQEISRRSYHARLYGETVTNDEASRQYLTVCARSGLLRSYVLTGKGQDLAFLMGFQNLRTGTLQVEKLGYDLRWGHCSPGAMALLLIIQHLYEPPPLGVVDFGPGGMEYKRIHGNYHYEEVNPILFLPTTYGRVLHSLDAAVQRWNDWAKGLLTRLGVWKRIKSALRRAGGSRRTAQGDLPGERGDPVARDRWIALGGILMGSW